MRQPITISRRHFLELGATAVATAALSPLVRARSAELDSLSVAFLSDTHLGKDANDKAADQMKMAVDEINACGAALTIMCGDLVHGGQDPKAEKHYPEWIQIASKFQNPWHAVPGNHDPDAIFVKH